MENTKLAYMAGIIDGEGNISVFWHRKKNSQSGLHELRITIANTDIRLIEWIISEFGGSINWVKNPNVKTHKQSYHWRLYSQKAADLLELVLPYLVIKKQQALLGIEFRETFEKAWSRFGGVPKEIFQKRKDVFDKFRILNKRGA